MAGNCLPYYNLVLSHYNPRRCCSLPGFMLMVGGRSFCLHALLGVLLPTTLVHSQLHQKRLTRPTCVNNLEHSTILFSHARCGAMFMELRSVAAWPISNTWWRPFLPQEGSGDLREGHPSVMKGASPSAKHPLKVPFTKA